MEVTIRQFCLRRRMHVSRRTRKNGEREVKWFWFVLKGPARTQNVSIAPHVAHDTFTIAFSGRKLDEGSDGPPEQQDPAVPRVRRSREAAIGPSVHLQQAAKSRFACVSYCRSCQFFFFQYAASLFGVAV